MPLVFFWMNDAMSFYEYLFEWIFYTQVLECSMIWFEDCGELWKLGIEMGHNAFFFFSSFCSLRMCIFSRLLGFFLSILCFLFMGFVV